MTQETKKLSVRLHGLEVGILEERNGKMRFKYLDNPEFELSLSLPIRKEVFPEKECRGYFGGLLPENENMREILAKKYKISKGSDFALLRAIGRECAGAVSFCEIGEEETVELYSNINCQVLSADGLCKHIKELPIKPYVGRRMSLAGAQEKTSVCMVNGKVALPVDDTPTTHIIKPATKFEDSIQNEFICMSAAKALGLDVANVEIRKVKDIEFLLIERFDRYIGENKGVETTMRKHQEDFAQASGVWASDKYDFTFKDCLKVIEQLALPALDKERFIVCAIYNFLIGNCDAHAKNFSLFHINNYCYLTPFYDLLCTSVYDLDNDMAMKIGNAKYAKDVTMADWEIFASDLDIKPKVVLDELKRQAESLPKYLIQAIELAKSQSGREFEIGDKILDYVNKNIEKVKKYLL